MSDRFICCEGDMDRVVFGALEKSKSYQILPEKPKPCTVRLTAGVAKALDRAIELVRTGVPVVVAALDLDSGTQADIYRRAESALGAAGLVYAGSEGRYVVLGTSFHALPVGIASNTALASLGICSHAIDDFLIQFLLDTRTYDGVVQSNRRPAPDHAKAVTTVRDSADHIRKSGVTFNSSKQVLDLFRAIIRFPASLASFAQSILRNAPPDLVAVVLKPLDDGLP